MKHRTFTDRDGVRWTVSEVTNEGPTFTGNRERRAEARSETRRPSESTRLATRPLSEPWLSFETATARRRITFVPAGWDELPEDRLEDLLGESAAF
jgi:hypothetical protein